MESEIAPPIPRSHHFTMVSSGPKLDRQIADFRQAFFEPVTVQRARHTLASEHDPARRGTPIRGTEDMASMMLKCVSMLALMAVAACNGDKGTASPDNSAAMASQAAPGIPADDPPVTDQAQPPARPQEKQDFFRIEGTWEKTRARLVQPSASLPFSTYMPEGMEFDHAASDEGEGFFFFAALDGRRNPDAFMIVFVLPEGTSEAEARKKADAFVASHRGLGLLSGARLGSHRGRYFYVAYRYPGDFGDGMGARMAYVCEHWVWLDGNTPLNSTLQPE